MPRLKFEILQNTLHITLDDRSTQNSLSPWLVEELDELIHDQETFDSILLSHEGPFFSSGGNLALYQKLESKKDGLKINRKISKTLHTLAQLDVLKVAYVNGPCLGGGVELLSCFNEVVATPKALFGLWQRRIGLTLGWGAEERLTTRLGEATLKRWLIGAETINVYEAQKRGLVDHIVLAPDGLNKCFELFEKNRNLGVESSREILKCDETQDEVFKKLWLGELHKKALSRFKNE